MLRVDGRASIAFGMTFRWKIVAVDREAVSTGKTPTHSVFSSWVCMHKIAAHLQILGELSISSQPVSYLRSKWRISICRIAALLSTVAVSCLKQLLQRMKR